MNDLPRRTIDIPVAGQKGVFQQFNLEKVFLCDERFEKISLNAYLDSLEKSIEDLERAIIDLKIRISQ